MVCSIVHAHFDLVIVSKLCLYNMYRNIFDFLKRKNLCIYPFYFLAGKWRLFYLGFLLNIKEAMFIFCV